jgi:hypothetical protein
MSNAQQQLENWHNRKEVINNYYAPENPVLRLKLALQERKQYNHKQKLSKDPFYRLGVSIDRQRELIDKCLNLMNHDK